MGFGLSRLPYVAVRPPGEFCEPRSGFVLSSISFLTVKLSALCSSLTLTEVFDKGLSFTPTNVGDFFNLFFMIDFNGLELIEAPIFYCSLSSFAGDRDLFISV